ncbi:MAG: FAD-binding oxidoreductase [Nakamurella sp.]
MTTTSPSAGPTATSRTASAGADYRALAKGLTGTLVLPSDGAFRRARELFNPRFDDIHPQAVAQCASVDDVAACVAFARRARVPLAVRSGGHCYEGWSVGPGLVIDTGPLKTVQLDSGTAVVGAGARLIDVYSALASHGVGISGGSCPTVGIAGLTLGGGLGVVDRMWGLACDNLTAVTVVTADGKAVRCSPSSNADLFWACQGGAGGTFGVATSFTFRTRPIEPVATWGRSWPWSRAGDVVDAWLRWLPSAPDELWGSVHLSSAPGSSTPKVSVVGTYFGGDVSALDRVLDGLVSAAGSAPSSQFANSHAFLDAKLVDAGCGDADFAACHLEPAGTVTHQAYSASSDWIDKPMPPAGTATLLTAIQNRHDSKGAPDVAVQLDASGGAINRVDPASTAFVHRRSICSVQYIANWYDDTPAAAVDAAALWPHQTRHAMQPYVTGSAYQNYVDDQIADWSQAYFGANYRRLQQVKATYDPDNLFHHPQSVTA